jgi:tetratricopeptide (TPR) repeat protein
VKRPLFQLDADVSPVADSPDPENAERLLAALLADPTQAKRSSLWRQAARVAERRKQYDLARQRLERALKLEAKQSHDLAALRRDYAWFLSLSHKRAKELIALRRPVPRDWLDGVVAIADRWRAVDPVEWMPCFLAARILNLAGERELAWAYLTTPPALHGSTAANWLEVARQQYWQNDYDLAERAFAVASSLEPADTEIVRERAVNRRAAERSREKGNHP